MVTMRLQDPEQLAILGDYRQLHDAFGQYPAFRDLHEFDRALQNAMNFSQSKVSGVCKGYLQRREVPVCQLAQHSVECQGDKLGMLSGQLIEREHTSKSQYCFVLPTCDLKADLLSHGCRIPPEIFECFGHRRAGGRNVVEETDTTQVHLCRNVQPKQRIVRFGS